MFRIENRDNVQNRKQTGNRVLNRKYRKWRWLDKREQGQVKWKIVKNIQNRQQKKTETKNNDGQNRQQRKQRRVKYKI